MIISCICFSIYLYFFTIIVIIIIIIVINIIIIIIIIIIMLSLSLSLSLLLLLLLFPPLCTYCTTEMKVLCNNRPTVVNLTVGYERVMNAKRVQTALLFF